MLVIERDTHTAKCQTLSHNIATQTISQTLTKWKKNPFLRRLNLNFDSGKKL